MKAFIKLLIFCISLIIHSQNNYSTSFQNTAKIIEMDSLVKANHFKNISSILVSYNDELIFEAYYNGNSEETLHNTRSATKSITGTLIGCLIEGGKLKSVNESVYKYSKPKRIANWDKRKKDITFEDLLTMSSSLECNDWNELSRGNEERMYLIEDWAKFYWDLPIKGFPEWETKPKDNDYGRSFSYCTAGTVVLGDAIENLTGSLKDYADSALFKKLDITDYHWQLTPKGIPMTGGGLGLKSKDLVKLGQLYLNKGKWNGEQLISEDWVRQSTTPKAKIDFGAGYEYGYLFWLSQFANEKAFYMTGTGGNKVVMFPDLNAVVVLTSTFYNGGMQSHQQTDTLLNEFIIPEIKKIK